MGAQLASEASRDFCLVNEDLENAYNKIMPVSIIDSLFREEVFKDIIAYFYETMDNEGYVGMKSGLNLPTKPFRLAEGVHVGRTSIFCSLAVPRST